MVLLANVVDEEAANQQHQEGLAGPDVLSSEQCRSDNANRNADSFQGDVTADGSSVLAVGVGGDETTIHIVGALATDGDDGSTLVSSYSGWAAGGVDNRQLGPGAYHVVPRTTLTRNSGLDSAPTASDTFDPEGNNPRPYSSAEARSSNEATNPAGIASTTSEGDDLPIVVTATLVEDDSDVSSGDHPPSALSSTLVTHAMSEDDSGGAEAPALSLVDQRVVDERISKLKGEYKKTLSKQRSTVVAAALLVLLAIVLVVSISVPLTRPTTAPAPSFNATGTNATGTVELLAEWDRCTISSECKVWSDGTGCCTAKYTGGVSKCTPLSPWFNQRTNECVVDVPATFAPTPAPNNSKADWATCGSNGECLTWAAGTGCCTGKYSGGVTKCTPLSPWFNERTNECVSDDTTAPTPTPPPTLGTDRANVTTWIFPDNDLCSAIIAHPLERIDTPASGGNPNEFYGMSSAVSGSSMVFVGSPGTEGIGLGGNVHKLGRVHVFQSRLVDGEGGSEDAKWTWEEDQDTSPLEPSERETKYGLVESFGFRVVTSEDVLAVTAFGDGFGLRRLGMVYIYRRDPDSNTWNEEAIITPPLDANDDDDAVASFGTQIAVSGDTIVVTSPMRDNSKGAAYVFSRHTDMDDGHFAWIYQAKLEASDGKAGDEFGSSVAIEGHTVVSGSVRAQDEEGHIVGKAYMFSRDKVAGWAEKDILTSPDAQRNSEFGFSVSIHNGIVAVGAPFAGPSGSVYVYECSDAGQEEGAACVETAKIVALDASEFGGSLSMHGDILAIGAPSTPTQTSSGPGIGGGVYVYKGKANSWSLLNKFKYPGTESFGRSIGISDMILVSSDPVYYQPNSKMKSGAAFAVGYLQTNQTTLC